MLRLNLITGKYLPELQNMQVMPEKITDITVALDKL